MEKENIFTKKIHIKDIFSSISNRHGSYLYIIYVIPFYIGGLYGIFNWLKDMFITVSEGNFIGFILTLLLQWIYAFISAVFTSIIWGTILLIITIIPYLAVRGLIRK